MQSVQNPYGTGDDEGSQDCGDGKSSAASLNDFSFKNNDQENEPEFDDKTGGATQKEAKPQSESCALSDLNYSCSQQQQALREQQLAFVHNLKSN